MLVRLSIPVNRIADQAIDGGHLVVHVRADANALDIAAWLGASPADEPASFDCRRTQPEKGLVVGPRGGLTFR